MVPPKKGTNKVQLVTTTSQCVSLYKIISLLPGLIAQIKVRLTKNSYWAENVFLDHYIELGYDHLQISWMSEKKLFGAYRKRKSYNKTITLTSEELHIMHSYSQ